MKSGFFHSPYFHFALFTVLNSTIMRITDSKRRTLQTLPIATILLAFSILPVSSGDAQPQARPGWDLAFSPATDLYPRYIADPRRSRFGLSSLGFSHSEIEDTGESRLGIRLGGRYGLLRLHREDDPDHGFQVDIEGGFIGQFDQDNSTDNIGWDGIYGLHVAWARPGGLALRLGVFHDSSHVGDELAERTGRQRINYTRQEFLLGVSYRFAPEWRTYAEYGSAFDLRNPELMKRRRVQGGIEYESSRRFWRRRLGWYAATDLSLFEEDSWQVNTTVQAGVVLPRAELGRIFRVGLEYYEGRSQLGEFFQSREEYVGFGFWFDL